MLYLGSPTLETASARPVPLRMRGDLIVQRRTIGDSQRYVIKDPIGLAHHQLWEEEYLLLQLLDGRRSMQQMRREFERRFQPARLDFVRLEALHGMFYRQGLVVSENAGQAAALLAQRERSRSWNWQRILGSLFSFRLPGYNPDRFLSRLDHWLGWCLRPTGIVLSLLFIVGTALFALSQWSTIWARIPGLDEYLTAANVFWLAVAFMVLKVLHELGHGLACKHFGGECNEIGIMFLMLTPCLYCDVSDAWLIESKSRRASIAVAGIWVELIVASACMWLWWLSFPGTINTLCFNVMCIGGVGTLLFNANPLLRYDGYFVLSDLANVPNLWERSRAKLNALIEQFYVADRGRSRTEMPDETASYWAVYAILSIAYQLFVTLFIIGFLYGVFQSLRLEVIGGLLSVLLCVAMIGWPMGDKAARLFNDRRRIRHLRRRRVLGTTAIAIVFIALFCFCPLPCHVRAPVMVRPSDAQPVVVLVGGQLENCVAEGTRVARGDVLAELSSPADQLSIEAKRGELARLKVRLTGLEARRGSDSIIGAQITSTRQAIEGCQAELQRLSSAVGQLILKSPIDGIVVAAGSRTAARSASASNASLISGGIAGDMVNSLSGTVSASAMLDGLEFWSGTPLQTCNRGCYLSPGQTLCQIAPATSVEALVVVTQSQVQWLELGQSAVARLTQLPGKSLSGQVVEISAAAQRELPAELAKSNVIPVREMGDGRYESVQPHYVARIQLDASTHPIAQTVGSARIRVRPCSLGTRLWRLLSETFGWQVF